MTLYRVVLSYCCGAVIVRDSKIISTAPIFNWAKGKSIEKFSAWVYSKGGKVEKV